MNDCINTFYCTIDDSNPLFVDEYLTLHAITHISSFIHRAKIHNSHDDIKINISSNAERQSFVFPLRRLSDIERDGVAMLT